MILLTFDIIESGMSLLKFLDPLFYVNYLMKNVNYMMFLMKKRYLLLQLMILKLFFEYLDNFRLYTIWAADLQPRSHSKFLPSSYSKKMRWGRGCPICRTLVTYCVLYFFK